MVHDEQTESPYSREDFLFGILRSNAEKSPKATALRFKGDRISYHELVDLISTFGDTLASIGTRKTSRIAALLPNCPEALIVAFSTIEAGAIFVPINPLYRPRQTIHVLDDCSASLLVTTRYLFAQIADRCRHLPSLKTVVFIDSSDYPQPSDSRWETLDWSDTAPPHDFSAHQPATDLQPSDPAVIFYTSGSSGRAKGVTISHKNLLDGARIVSGYLGNSRRDRVLAALPLSFDYGFSQATTMLFTGGELVLTNYTLPRTLLSELAESRATGLAGVPTMWAQLAKHKWPSTIADHLRYVTNSGGRLPANVLCDLRSRLPDTRIYLMYGLTEAFRSSYLDPALVDELPDSIGQAIPEVDLHVVRPDGSLCDDNEPGELVHTGALVALGYWNNEEATQRRYRPFGESGTAVWSGDIVTRNKDGYLFFVERADNMIKCSGYRISPTEIEETIHESGLVEHVAAIGIPDPSSGQKIGLVIVPKSAHDETDFAIRHVCAMELPPYMQPDEIVILEKLLLSANGKPDRVALAKLFNSPQRLGDD